MVVRHHVRAGSQAQVLYEGSTQLSMEVSIHFKLKVESHIRNSGLAWWYTPSIPVERQADLSETSLVYKVNSRLAMVTYSDPIPPKTKENTALCSDFMQCSEL